MREKYKLFDFVDAITTTKEDLFKDPEAKMDYVPFLVNKAMSFYGDTVLYANELNQHASLPKEWQFYFYLNSIPKKKRFSKWVNKDKESKSLNIVMEYYGYSAREAENILSILTKQQLTTIEEKLKKGGRNDY